MIARCAGRLAETSSAVAKTSSRLKKIELLASCLARLRPDEVPSPSPTSPERCRRGGSASDGPRFARSLRPSLPQPTLELLDVDAAFRRIGALAGSGSQAERKRELTELFGRTTEVERAFLLRLLSGEIRQGALEGVMIEAIARAASVPAPAVRRALMVAGNLGDVATAALSEGASGLARFRLRLLTPLQPMLAQTAEDLDDALARISPAGVEWKLDGARIQVHRLGDEVRVFTRNLADATHRAPEVAQAVAELPVDSVVLDGEAIALRADGRPHPFQVTMSRFGSRVGVDELRDTTPLSCFFFDCLHLDGADLLDLPAAERRSIMERALPGSRCVPRIVGRDAQTRPDGFLDEAIERGHEGVMVKALDAPYEAGRRGAGWLKVKRAVTLDLVVLAVEWGHGRREGWLSNLHLGARDPSTGGFVMLGKTFKGMTDEMLGWQTERLLELESHREGITVHVRPELVVEVAFDGVQASTRYPGGLALRFARVKGYRPDKRADEADTIDTVRALYRASSG